MRQARDKEDQAERLSLAATLHRLAADAARITARAEAKDDLRCALIGVQTQARLVELRHKMEEAQAIEDRITALEQAVAHRRTA